MAFSIHDVVGHLEHFSPSLARAGGEDRGGEFFTWCSTRTGRMAAILMVAVSSWPGGDPISLGGDLRSDWPWSSMELLHIR